MWDLIIPIVLYLLVFLPPTLIINYLFFRYLYRLYKKNKITKRRSKFKVIRGDKPSFRNKRL